MEKKGREIRKIKKEMVKFHVEGAVHSCNSQSKTEGEKTKQNKTKKKTMFSGDDCSCGHFKIYLNI